MRTARAFPEDGSQAGVFHCISRVVDRRFILDDPEKRLFVSLLRACETFYGVRVLTFAVLSNHFHLLVEVPPPEPLTEEEVLRRIAALYPPKFVSEIRSRLVAFRSHGLELLAEDLLSRFTSRMFSLSNFMKSLKQRFSAAYNRSRARKGTLWEERFKSVIVQPDEKALIIMALYIDLNPVRAGIVSDPAEYAYSGYGQAVGGSEKARAGLCHVLPERAGWEETQRRYRMLLYEYGIEREGSEKKGFTLEEVESVQAEGGRIATPALLRHRVKHLTEGWILGTKAFIDEWFGRNRWRFGDKRKNEARRMRASGLEDLVVLADTTLSGDQNQKPT